MYTEQLPRINSLKLLAREIRNFPITGLGIVQHAEHLGCDKEIIDFLRLFSQGILFNSRNDFLNQCSLLEKLLEEESQSVPEHLRSPQD
ncbi:hypothetical protein COU91_01260 [Candidatus Saccharibacteria bacterium CG10_big_fil_rev_8_21_14_0_10_47_8]|nr:MAG: hypothetical protein COU91_01260 [Candidatus Saccharibacteria bacterium CG10_big_fil_rev_8_21_14_0_10_47_8]